MRNFTVRLEVEDVDSESDFFTDANVDVELPTHMTIDAEQQATLTKMLASTVGEFLRKTYEGAEITVCS